MFKVKEELLEALKVIAEECDAHASCLECPLYKIDNGCITQDENAPANWDLEELEGEE